MNNQTEQLHKLKYPGAIDADGHFIEYAKLWENYSEAKYKAARCVSNGLATACNISKSTAALLRCRAARPSVEPSTAVSE